MTSLQDYEKSKPAPDCFLMAAEKIGVPPEFCVGYEDAVLGMEAIRQVYRQTICECDDCHPVYSAAER